MTDFSTLLQQGNPWVFIPSAILLRALHGLEPGHSKTMMAAFSFTVAQFYSAIFIKLQRHPLSINNLMPEIYEDAKYAVENMTPQLELVNIASFYYLKFKPETETIMKITDESNPCRV